MVLGGTTSVSGLVVTVTQFDAADIFPAASRALTLNETDVLGSKFDTVCVSETVLPIVEKVEQAPVWSAYN